MWGRANHYNSFTVGSGAAGTEQDISSLTAAPSGDPTAQTGAMCIARKPTDELGRRVVDDELHAVFHLAGASGVAMDVRPWFYIPEYKLNGTTGVGTWKAGRLLQGIPLDAETTADAGTIYRIPVPHGATYAYLQRDAVTGSPTATEAAVFGGEEIH